MKQTLISIARNLVHAAKDRAEHAMHKQAQLRILRAEDYTANAGGWN